MSHLLKDITYMRRLVTNLQRKHNELQNYINGLTIRQLTNPNIENKVIRMQMAVNKIQNKLTTHSRNVVNKYGNTINLNAPLNNLHRNAAARKIQSAWAHRKKMNSAARKIQRAWRPIYYRPNGPWASKMYPKGMWLTKKNM